MASPSSPRCATGLPNSPGARPVTSGQISSNSSTYCGGKGYEYGGSGKYASKKGFIALASGSSVWWQPMHASTLSTAVATESGSLRSMLPSMSMSAARKSWQSNAFVTS